MTTVVAGAGLGLFNTSLNQPNGFGGSGAAKPGNGVDGVYVNAATGNLVIQGQDDVVMATGLDVLGVRTYNSRGTFSDDNGDNWLLGLNRRLVNPPAGIGGLAPLPTSGSIVTRENGDGNRSDFNADLTALLWRSTDGPNAHDTIKTGGTGTNWNWVWTDGDTGVTETYDQTGRLLSVKDRDGNTLTYNYTGSLLTSVMDQSSQTTYIEYSGTRISDIKVVSGSENRVRVRYGYDGSGRLSEVRVDLNNPGDTVADADAQTYVTSYGYDGSGRLSSLKQSRKDNLSATQSELAISYTADGRVWKLTTVAGSGQADRVMEFTYVSSTRTDVKDALGYVTSYYYDAGSRLTQVTTPAVGGSLVSTVYAYDGDGNVSQVTDGAGRSVRYRYDGSGNLIKTWDDLGNTVERTYDAGNQILTETRYVTPDPDGEGTGVAPSNPLTTNFYYDGEEHLVYVVAADGQVMQHLYEANGDRKATIVYGASPFSGTRSQANVDTYVSQQDKTKSQRTDYTYLRGQLNTMKRFQTVASDGTGVNDATAATTQFTYSIAGQLLQTVDPRNAAYVTNYVYDGLGRLTQTTDATGRITNTLFDDAGNRVVMTAASGLITTTVYNKAGEKLSVQLSGPGSEALGTTLYGYDANGRLRMVTDPTGARLHYLYNERGWLVGSVGADGLLTETQYNAAGQAVKTIAYPDRLESDWLVDGQGNVRAVTLTDVKLLMGLPVDVAPQLDLDASGAGTGFTASWVEHQGWISVVDTDLTIADADGQTLTQAYVELTGRLNGASELLAVVTEGTNVTATFDAVNGILRLTGADTPANYQQVLRTLSYTNVATTPVAGARTLKVTVDDGQLSSAVASSTVSLTPSNAAPVLDLDANNSSGATGNNFSTTFTEDGGWVSMVDADLTLTDTDSALLSSATVTITNLQNSGQEWLGAIVEGTTISQSYSNGVLTLSGADSVANYQQVLRSLKYNNTSQQPGTTARSISVVVRDQQNAQATATATVSIASQADVAPVVGGVSGTTATHTTGTNWTAVVPALALTDADSVTLASATVQLGSRPDGTAELLGVITEGTSISASYNPASGILTLSGVDSVANYQQVLRSARYDNTALAATTGGRTVTVTVSDGQASASASATVTVASGLPAVPPVPLNGTPVVDLDANNSSTSGNNYQTGSPGFTEDGGWVRIVDIDLVVADLDSANLTSAQATITNAYDNTNPLDSVERLGVITQGTAISGYFSGSTLYLSGTDSVANYQRVLRTLSYNNRSQNPNTTARSIQVTVSDGTSTSAAAVSTVSITAVGDAAPVLDLDANNSSGATGANYNATWVEHAGWAAITDLDLTLSSAGSPTLTSATVTLGSRQNGDKELLAILKGSDNKAVGTNIAASFNASSGVLTLSGLDSVANYRQALRTLAYNNIADIPVAGARTATVVVSNGENTATVVATINLTLSNAAPVLDLDASGAGSGYTTSFVEDGGWVWAVDRDLVLTDTDSPTLTSATITLLNPPNGVAAERLAVLTAGTSISWSYGVSGNNGVLTLTGTDTVANYQQVLRSLRYLNKGNATAGARQINFVVNDGRALSTTVSATINVSAANDAPVLDIDAAIPGTGYRLSYVAGAAPVYITHATLGISDADSVPQLTSAIVTLRNRLNGASEELLFTQSGGIGGSYNAATGVLTLTSAPTSISSYVTVLRSLQYRNLASTAETVAGPRTVDFVVNDGTGSSNTASVTIDVLWDTAAIEGNRTMQSFYDGAGRLVYLVDAENYPTQIVYDGAGRKTQEIRYANALTSALPANPVTGDVTSRLNASAANDRRTRYFYDGSGHLRGTVDGAGYLTEVKYDAAGRMQETIRYANLAVTGNSIDVTTWRPATNAADQHSYCVYNARGEQVGCVDGENRLTEYTYDLAGNKLSEIRYSGTVAWTAAKTIATLRSEANASTPAGQVASRTRSWAYDSLSRVTQETDAAGIVMKYEYHAQTGFLTKTTRAFGTTEAREVSATYDLLGHIKTQSVDPTGLALLTQHFYDLSGRRIKSIDPNNNATFYYYDRQSQLRFTINALGEVTETSYNAFGQATAQTAFAGIISVSGLTGGLVDATVATRVDALRTSSSNRTVYSGYNQRGLATLQQDALGFRVQSSYANGFGELLSRVTDIGASRGASTRTDTYSYDARGQLKTLVEDAGGIARTTRNVLADGVTSSFDAFGRLTRTLDPNGNVRSMTYDRLGRTVTVTDPAGNRTTAYDAHSRVLTQTDRLNNTTSFAYNDTTRTITVTTPEGIATTRTSNRHGQEISITLTNNGVPETTTYTYDKGGRLTKVTDPDTFFTESKYDKAGLLRASIDKNGVRTTYEYDAANRLLKRVVDAQVDGNDVSYSNPTGLALQTLYDYSAFGEVIKVTDAEDVVSETVYDRNGRTVTVIVDTVDRANKPAALKVATTYTLDAQGRQLIVREGIQATGTSGSWNTAGAAARTTNYTYDKLGRRATEVLDPGALNVTTQYVYDQSGNVVRKIDAGGSTWRQVYDGSDREVFSINPLGYVSKREYDAESRVTKTVQYVNAINTASLSDSSTVSNVTALLTADASQDRVHRTAYDKDGRRVFEVDGLNFVTENVFDGNGSVVRTIRYATALGGSVPITVTDVAAQRANLGDSRVQRRVYDQVDRLRFVVDELNYITETRYDSVGRVTDTLRYYSLPSNLTTGSPTVAQVQAALVTHADDQHTHSTYDAAGRLLTVRDSQNNTESYTWDKVGNRISLTNKLGNVWNYVYDGASRLTKETAPAVTLHVLDGSNKVILDQTASASVTKVIDYDALGNVTTRREGYAISGGSFVEQRRTTFLYDALGRQVRTVYPEVGVYSAALENADYNAGATGSYADRREQGQSLSSHTYFDAFGHAVANRDAGGRFTYKTYDVQGRVKYEVDAERFLTAYTYDAFGNVTAVTRFAARVIDDVGTADADKTTLLNYEASAYSAGNANDAAARAAAINAHALISSRAGQLVQSAASSAKRVLTTDYDLLNRKVVVRQPTVDYYLPTATTSYSGQAQPTTEFRYNGFGELTRERSLRNPQSAEWVSAYFGYDKTGRRTHQLDALNYLTRTEYDGLGRAIRSSEYAKAPSLNFVDGLPDFSAYTLDTTAPAEGDPLGYDRVMEYEYDRMDRRLIERRVNVQYWQHNAAGSDIETSAETSTLRSSEYDAVGNLTAQSDEAGATTRTYYDALGRVVAVAEPVRPQESTANAASLQLMKLETDFNVHTESEPNGSGGTNYYRDYEYKASWTSLAHWGDGRIRLTLDRSGIADVQEIFSSGTFRNYYWSTFNYATGVISFTVEKEVLVNGAWQWQLVHSSSNTNPRLDLRGLPANVDSVKLEYRTDVGGAVQELSMSPLHASWAIDLPAAMSGNYEYRVLAYDDGVPVDLTSLGLSAIWDSDHLIFVARPAGEPVTVQVTGLLLNVSPLTTFTYDATGAQVTQKKHAKGTLNPTATVPQPAGTDAGADQLTKQRTDALGRVIEVIDAEGKSAFRSYDAYGNLAKEWRLQTDEVASVTRQQTEIFEYDRVGRLAGNMQVVRNPFDTSQRLMRTVTDYNAYGESIEKGVGEVALATDAVARPETVQYDAAGRAWQTNTGGVTKAYQYDLLGRVSAEVQIPGTANGPNQSPTLGSLANPSQIASAAGGVRTVYVTDALGRIVEQRRPGMTAAEQIAAHVTPITMDKPGSGSVAGVFSDAEYEPPEYPFPGGWSGSNTINLAWPSLSAQGFGGGSYWVSGTYVGTNSSGNSGSASFPSRYVAVGTNDTGISITWAPGGYGHATSVSSFTVQKWIDGVWEVVVQYPATSATDQFVTIVPPAVNPAGAAPVFEAQLANGSFVTLGSSLLQTGRYSVGTAALAAGTYAFRISIADTAGVRTDAGVSGVYWGTLSVAANRTVTIVTPARDVTLEAPVIQQTVDRWGNTLTVTDPRNASWVTTYRYNHLDDIISQTQPAVTDWKVDGTASASPVAPVTEMYYDLRGNLIGSRDPKLALSRRYYNAAGQLTLERNEMGEQAARHIYDALGRRVKRVEAHGEVTAFTYDRLDRLTLQRTDGFTLVRYEAYRYDELGNRLQVSVGTTIGDSNGLVTRYRYDTRGNVLAAMTPLAGTNAASDFITHYEYDALGRRSKETNGHKTDGTNRDYQQWTYDYFGRLIGYRDLAGVQYEHTYDGLGRLVKIANAATSQTIVNAAIGNEPVATHGQNVRYTYYTNGQLMHALDDANFLQTTYGYDTAGNRISENVSFGASVPSFVRATRTRYDALGRTDRVVSGLASIEYGYDLAGNRRFSRTDYREAVGGSLLTKDYWYLYDAADRMTLTLGQRVVTSSQAVDQTGAKTGAFTLKATATQGVELGYDAAGQRTMQRQKEGTMWAQRRFGYDPAGRVLDSYVRRHSDYLSVPNAAEYKTSERVYDLYGRLTTYIDYGINGGTSAQFSKLNEYNRNGWLVRQSSYSGNMGIRRDVVFFSTDTAENNPFSDTDTSAYTATGNVKSYVLENYNGTAYSNYYDYSYLRWGGGYKERKIKATGSIGPGSFVPGTTTEAYDKNGGLISVGGPGVSDRSFTLGANSMVLERYDSEATKRQYYYYSADHAVGSAGQVFTADFDYNYTAISAAYDPPAPKQSKWAALLEKLRKKREAPREAPIDGNAAGATPGTYTVQEGDTLQAIALRVWGDASLWYLLADANGVSTDADIHGGMTLIIPNSAQLTHNSSSTFRPYNPGEIVGSTAPQPKYKAPPRPSRLKRAFVAVMTIAVTLVVMFYAGPLVSKPAAAILGAAAGNTAGQLTAIGLDIQDGFDAKQLGAAVLSAAVSGGLAAEAQGMELAARTAFNNLMNQGINIAFKLQAEFSWGSLAAAALTAGLPQSARENLGIAAGQAPSQPFELGYMLMDTARHLVANVVRRTIQIAVDGEGKMDWVDVAADAFGNALGNSIVGQMKYNALPEKVKQAALTDPDAIHDYDVLRWKGWSEADASEAVQPDPKRSPASTVAGTIDGDGTPASAFAGDSYQVAGTGKELGLRSLTVISDKPERPWSQDFKHLDTYLKDEAQNSQSEMTLWKRYTSTVETDFWPDGSNRQSYIDAAYRDFYGYVDNHAYDLVNEGVNIGTHYGPDLLTAEALRTVPVIGHGLAALYEIFDAKGELEAIPDAAMTREALKLDLEGPQLFNRDLYKRMYGLDYDFRLNPHVPSETRVPAPAGYVPITPFTFNKTPNPFERK